jgi:hypothetical protein
MLGDSDPIDMLGRLICINFELVATNAHGLERRIKREYKNVLYVLVNKYMLASFLQGPRDLIWSEARDQT